MRQFILITLAVLRVHLCGATTTTTSIPPTHPFAQASSQAGGWSVDYSGILDSLENPFSNIDSVRSQDLINQSPSTAQPDPLVPVHFASPHPSPIPSSSMSQQYLTPEEEWPPEYLDIVSSLNRPAAPQEPAQFLDTPVPSTRFEVGLPQEGNSYNWEDINNEGDGNVHESESPDQPVLVDNPYAMNILSPMTLPINTPVQENVDEDEVPQSPFLGRPFITTGPGEGSFVEDQSLASLGDIMTAFEDFDDDPDRQAGEQQREHQSSATMPPPMPPFSGGIFSPGLLEPDPMPLIGIATSMTGTQSQPVGDLTPESLAEAVRQFGKAQQQDETQQQATITSDPEIPAPPSTELPIQQDSGRDEATVSPHLLPRDTGVARPRMILPAPPQPHQLPPDFWLNMGRYMRKPYKFERRDSRIQRDWIAHKDRVNEEVLASQMIHETLMSHVASIRCPVYAIILRWIVDTRATTDRRNDPRRRINRHTIQMLSFRVALEPRFYHDAFFVPRFGTVVNRFASAARSLEMVAKTANDLEVWYDLVSCLLEYGNTPPPGRPTPEVQRSMLSFLSDEKRRRQIARMVMRRGRRNERVDHLDQVRLIHLASMVPDFELISYRTVVAMMDSDMLKTWKAFMSRQHDYASRNNPPLEPSYPVWPDPADPVMPYEPVTDFNPMPIYVPRFWRHETQNWASKLSDLHRHSLNEPYLSRHAPKVQRPDERPVEEYPTRQIRQLLNDTAVFYNIRFRLLTESTREPNLWSRFAIESVLEFTIVARASPEIPHTMVPCADAMFRSFEIYQSLGDTFDRLANILYRNFVSYRNSFSSLQLTWSNLNGLLQLDLFGELITILNTQLDAVEQDPAVIIEHFLTLNPEERGAGSSGSHSKRPRRYHGNSTF